ncbi:MAG: hypothetical protein KAJ18_01080 [Candidatus Omnitrophica bacterium]|nr:hypothetical protein [Candidatus Omnitrophota bacterium]
MSKEKIIPIIIFVIFLGLILGATIYHDPGFGLMDDHANLQIVSEMRAAANPVQWFFESLWRDLTSWGAFRPVYRLWVIGAYSVFYNMPLGLYLVIAVVNMGALLIWGMVFYKMINVRKEDFSLTVFLFPLSFFLFTPFWNIFMYISVKEKFLVFFTAVSLYFFQKSYETMKKKDIVWAFVFCLIGLFSKPTGIYLLGTYTVFAFCDWLFFKREPKLSRLYFFLNAGAGVLYAWFTTAVQLQGGYTKSYGTNLAGKIMMVPAIIKLLFILGLVVFIFSAVRVLMKKKEGVPFYLMMPLGMLAYLSILIPWGSQTYLLPPVTPFVLGLFFPVYAWFNRKHMITRVLANGVLIVLLGFVFTGIINPRISKVGDIAKAERFIKEKTRTGEASRYFFPPPFEESFHALIYFTKQDIVYLGDRQLRKEMLRADGKNYLLVNDACTAIQLKDVRPEKEIFANGTWRIMRLVQADGEEAPFLLEFPKTCMQKLKQKIKNL